MAITRRYPQTGGDYSKNRITGIPRSVTDGSVKVDRDNLNIDKYETELNLTPQSDGTFRGSYSPYEYSKGLPSAADDNYASIYELLKDYPQWLSMRPMFATVCITPSAMDAPDEKRDAAEPMTCISSSPVLPEGIARALLPCGISVGTLEG